jgi:GntR family transcriptional regulator, transcriptional repressor for pyruvate dehydrogenase complex
MLNIIMSDRGTVPTGDPAWDRRSEKVSAVIAREIVRDIARQRLAPGTTLESESAMLRRYQVARASLREGLRILETHGLIRIKPGPGGGPVVSGVDTADFGRMATLFFQVLDIRFAELTEARLVLEPVMARLAALRQNPTDNEELRDIAKAGLDADDTTWRSASRAFHDKVLSMSGNGLLNLYAGALNDIFSDRVSGLLYTGRQREQVKRIHADIADAISAGNADVAESLMREHMSDYKKAVTKRDAKLLDEVVDWR